MHVIIIKTKVFYRSPDYGEGIEAAEKIFELLNRQPTIDNVSNIGDQIVREYWKYSQSIFHSFDLAEFHWSFKIRKCFFHVSKST